MGVRVPSKAVKGSVTTGDNAMWLLTNDGNWKYWGTDDAVVTPDVLGCGLPGARGLNDDQKCTGPIGVLCKGLLIINGVGTPFKLNVGCRADAL